jgi:hypothetical protein
MDACLPTSGVARRSSFYIRGVTPKATMAFIGVGLVDGMQVSAQANLAGVPICVVSVPFPGRTPSQGPE